MTSISGVALGLALAISGAVLLFHVAPASPVAERATSELLYLPMVARQPTPACLDTPHFPADDRARELAVLEALNDERTEQGLSELAEDDRVTQAARRHSRDMADNDFTSHTGSDGSDAGQRLEEACYEWWSWGEIIAWGYSDASSVVAAWMDSDSHREIIVSSSYGHFGAGYAFKSDSTWGHYWTAVFASPRTDSASVSQAQSNCGAVYQDGAGRIGLSTSGAASCP